MRRVSARLPGSKTDPTATGCTRSGGCVCEEGRAGPCPYCAVVEQTAYNRATWGVAAELPGDFPLCPAADGGTPSKHCFVATVEAMAALLDVPLFDAAGLRRFGGHVWRISGARHLAKLGIALLAIMALARWASATALRQLR